ATLPTRAFLRLPRSPEPPPAPGRQSECHPSSAPPDSDLLGAVRKHPQLIATGRNELPTHAALLDPVAFQNTLHRSPIVPRGQSGHHAFPHRSLQFSILLQLTVALQFQLAHSLIQRLDPWQGVLDSA